MTFKPTIEKNLELLAQIIRHEIKNPIKQEKSLNIIRQILKELNQEGKTWTQNLVKKQMRN